MSLRSFLSRSLLCTLLGLPALALIGCGGDAGAPLEIKGAGASFPAPLYQRWFAEYGDTHAGTKVEYTSVGSGAGIKQFTQNLVDFGASDAAMTDEEMAAIPEGVQLLPMTAGSVVICYNLNDADGKPVPKLMLPRAVYSGIFLGEITKWNDPAIVAANPDVKLTEKPISVVYRSDSSGTTFVFTQHLAAVSEKFKTSPGPGMSVKWPTGSGAPKNDGVAGAVKQNDGAIGYVEYGFAEKNKIAMAWLENKAGKYPEPNLENAASALASAADFPPDLRIWIPDPEGESSYPIVTYTWILCRKTYPDAKKLEVMKAVLKHCLTDGQKVSASLGYIPLPDSVTQKIIPALDNITVAPAAKP